MEGYGVINIGNRELYQIFSGSKTIPSSWDMDIAGTFIENKLFYY